MSSFTPCEILQAQERGGEAVGSPFRTRIFAPAHPYPGEKSLKAKGATKKRKEKEKKRRKIRFEGCRVNLTGFPHYRSAEKESVRSEVVLDRHVHFGCHCSCFLLNGFPAATYP